MERFIQDLLEYSLVTTKTRPFAPVDLNEILGTVMSDLEIRIRETSAKVEIDELPVVEAEALQMPQLFQNILGNTIKYHRAGVPPVIHIQARALHEETKTRRYEIDAKDNGIGFDDSFNDQIFGLFRRLHGRSAYEGTGIGLVICKKIVEKHNGTIQAFGNEGEGSTFRILLPATQDNG